MPDVESFHHPGSDAHTLIEAQKIQEDSGRVNGALEYIKEQQERFAQMERDLPKVKTRVPNNSVRDSKMKV